MSVSISVSQWSELYKLHKETIKNGFVKDPYIGDFHSANTAPIFPEFDKLFREWKSGTASDGGLKAEKLRKIGKVIGLALLFQSKLSSAGYTVHYNSGVGDSPEEASRFTSQWYSKVPEFVDSTRGYIKLARTLGYSNSMIGTRRYIPVALDSGLPALEARFRSMGKSQSEARRMALKLQDKGFGEAVNMPIQGSGSVQSKFMLHEILKFIETYKLNFVSGNLKASDDIYTHLVQFNSNSSDLLSYFDTLPSGRTMVLVGDDLEYDRLVEFQDSWDSNPDIIIHFKP